jgi:hypothetical protein
MKLPFRYKIRNEFDDDMKLLGELIIPSKLYVLLALCLNFYIIIEKDNEYEIHTLDKYSLLMKFVKSKDFTKITKRTVIIEFKKQCIEILYYGK